VAYHVSIAGKGGTGKTTLAALVVRYLVERGKTPILCVDADPNANLNEALGLAIEGTIAGVLSDVRKDRGGAAGMSKHQLAQYRMSAALSESKYVDLLVMGGPEGEGCYCYPNQLLKEHVARLSGNYPYLVMDNEAGLEHLSRRIAQDVDVLLITSDPTVRGVRSAGRVRRLVESLETRVGEMYLVLNMTGDDQEAELRREAESAGLRLIGTVPRDPEVERYDLEGKPLFDLPATSSVVRAVEEICERIGI